MNGEKRLNPEEQVYLTELDRGPWQRRALDDHIQRVNALI